MIHLLSYSRSCGTKCQRNLCRHRTELPMQLILHVCAPSIVHVPVADSVSVGYNIARPRDPVKSPTENPRGRNPPLLARHFCTIQKLLNPSPQARSSFAQRPPPLPTLAPTLPLLILSPHKRPHISRHPTLQLRQTRQQSLLLPPHPHISRRQ